MLVLLLTGIGCVRLAFGRGWHEMRAFLLTYSVCVFVGGLAQSYALATFGDVQSTTDAFTFFRWISPTPPFTTMASLPPAINSRLAVVIWQQVYRVAWWAGLKFGPYTSVMFNALVVGLSGSLAVRTAREIFGDDAWRLRRVGTLFSLCGLFILFGAVLIRDCFVLFFNLVVLWSIIRWLVRPSVRRFLLGLGIILLSAWAMSYLRIQNVFLLIVYGFMALLLRFFLGRRTLVWHSIVIVLMGALLVSTSYLMSRFQSVRDMQARAISHYSALAADTHEADSLGMKLIINQPFPIRLVLGSGALMINPVPLWANFKRESGEYHWIKGYHGIYQVAVMPLLLAGIIFAIRLFLRDRDSGAPWVFLFAYLFVGVLGVAATSLEQRHLAQFMPSVMILAALPDTRKATVRNHVHVLAGLWIVLVLLVHLAWAVLKG
ncbi:hypothetical protein ACFLS5_02455 [Candidatus Bipolaricaulota bacterium]